MVLAVDVGNSQTSFGLFQSDKLIAHWRCQTSRGKTVDEYAAFLLPLLQRRGLSAEKIEEFVLCSVVPAVDSALLEFARSYLTATVCSIDWRSPLPFSIGVAVPSEVGADRLANAAYAVGRMQLPAIVVDIGTATTLDVVDEKRVYRGGAILPGPKLAVESLGLSTAKLPLIDLEVPKTAIGRSTVECIRAGVLLGYVDAVEGLLKRTEAELGKRCEVAFTGGYVGLFSSHVERPMRVVNDLTLEGVLAIHRHR